MKDLICHGSINSPFLKWLLIDLNVEYTHGDKISTVSISVEKYDVSIHINDENISDE